jgi:hypothetical protein
VIEIASREMGMRPMWVCSSSNPTFLIRDLVTKDLGKNKLLANWGEYNYNPLYVKMQYSQGVEALYGRLANVLIRSISFNKRRCCPAEHSWKNIPIWVRL